MVTLLCPSCGQRIETSSPADPAIRCPHCGAAPAKPLAVPSWFPESSPPADGAEAHTFQPGDQPTQVNTPAAGFPFLAPPRGPNELGWLGSYRIVRVLGQGGMGIVFQAEDTHLERPVALKVMAPDAAREVGARKRFLREARLTAAIRSDHIVTIHQVGEVNDIPYLAMELLQGETLSAFLQRGQRPTPAGVLDLALQVTRGLEAAHQVGLVHRDIKPSNIWLEAPGGRVKILDFGLARMHQDPAQLTQVGMVMGTPAYMAPEQAEGAAVDARSDLFSLGCVLYEYASGEPPFSGATTFAILTAKAVREPPSLRAVYPAVPPELSSLVMHLLAKKPDDRPPSATAVVAALTAVAHAHPDLRPAWLSGSRPPFPAVPAAPAAPSRRTFLLAGLGGVALAALGGGGYLIYRSSGRGARTPRATAPGVSGDQILFGMSGPFSGSTSELGHGVRAGIQTYFDHVNESGGIAGRKLKLLALDDNYEPDRALANVKRLCEEEEVFGFVGNVGTPTAEKVLPYILEKGVLYFGGFTGSLQLRKTPPDRYVFNYRPSLPEETEAATRYLLDVKKLKPEEIAVFSQDDGYGADGFAGVERVLRRHGRSVEQIVHVRYRRNTVLVEEAGKAILARQEIKAVVMVPTYKPAARFIRHIRWAGRKMLFTSTSFVGSAALAEELREAAPEFMEGVIVTQTVPPVDSHASLILTYNRHLRRHSPSSSPNSVSLEGYLTAAVLCEGLRRAGEGLTTETLIEGLEGIKELDIGLGVPVGFGQSKHQAITKVWAIVLDREGRYRPLDLE